MCSMPVCEACIIKESFGKRDEKTFQHRTRTLCPECYDAGIPHIDQTLKPGMKGKDAIHSLSETGSTCICTPKDGHLCLRCKIEQRSNLAVKLARCYGQGCTWTRPGGFSARICLWCDLRLPGERSRAEARRDYDARHLLARSHSSFEHRVDEELVFPKEQERIWRMEEERFRELRNLSARRQRTGESAEQERWHRTEALRRPDSMFYPPPPMERQRADNAAENNGRQGYLSALPSFVGREPPPLPSYEFDLSSAGTAAEAIQRGSDSKT